MGPKQLLPWFQRESIRYKIDTPWEIGLRSLWAHFTWRDSPCRVNFSWRDCPSGLYLEWRESLFKVIYTKVLPLKGIIINLPVQFYSLDILVPSCICDNEASSSDLKFKMYKLAHWRLWFKGNCPISQSKLTHHGFVNRTSFRPDIGGGGARNNCKYSIENTHRLNFLLPTVFQINISRGIFLGKHYLPVPLGVPANKDLYFNNAVSD